MANYVGNAIICTLILFSIIIIYVSTQIVKSFTEQKNDLMSDSSTYSWIIRLCLNLLGYSTVLLPGYLIYKYVCHSKYLQRAGKGCLFKLVETCFLGNGSTGLLDSPAYSPARVSSSSGLKSFSQDALILVYCFFGLQMSYLTWGYLQEKIMTQEYVNDAGEKSHFRDSQFLVFVNRILAFLMSGMYLIIKRQPRHTTPLYKYAFCSLSNIMSSWCQYEALKFVSFPTQVLAKASKIIPVMIMGKIVSKNSYEYYEYVTAVLISIGMTLFMLGSSTHTSDSATTISGIILLAGYMVLDSFTSNWQNALFVEYGVTSIQMMCAVNMFSCMLTAMSLFQQSSFVQTLDFVMKYHGFIVDCLLISVCSASGQLFIFYTISQFGAVTFVIMMTIRQGLAILISCLVYQHNITVFGVIGVFIVFGSVFLRIYCSNRLRAIRRRRAESSVVKD
ncbi:adenosine 3'-phospho 5'-phosphosulfate transporter 1 [Venturia canescens]|uniref:adenosine 3'-phospho 5'-phosphosulfate transporter 1 n=1 Tax=Venturia canescens TaxID=32260 RepID=UPI001C9D52FA|nr:adenosine 3'-phospho 5'-phosphosulfate transporter 1 [Venturia canescens]